MLDPKGPKEEKHKSIYNMMASGKGNSLDITKQVCQVGLRAKCCKNIAGSESLKREKYLFERTTQENDEQKAVYQSFMIMKMRQLKYKIE